MGEIGTLRPIGELPDDQKEVLHMLESISSNNICQLQSIFGPADGGSLALAAMMNVASNFVMQTCPGTDPKATWDQVCKCAWENALSQQVRRAKEAPGHG